MIEVSILTQDFITYEIALQTRKLKSSMKDTGQSHRYIHKAAQIWCFYQNKRFVGSYKEIKFRGDVESKLDFRF
jgi:hypothetical protein